MKNLIEILTAETQILKDEFISKTKTWSSNEFDTLMEFNGWDEAKWCEYFGLTPRVANPGTSIEFLSFPTGFHNTRNSAIRKRIKDEAYRAKQIGREKFIEKQIDKAEKHYEMSIVKLSDRISKKGLNTNNLSCKTGRVGINIETTLTDGTKTVRAWTIVAEGEVQRPHYRYLVK